jgi:sodium-dependent dicarboxylate transporter 2/3/5
MSNTTTTNPANLKKTIMLLFSLAVALFFWLVPRTFFGYADDGITPYLSINEQRTVAIFVFAALMWITEAIPAWTTSVVTIVVMLLTISDKGISFFRSGDPAAVGNLVSYKSILATFADPTVMLFLGGFILAIATTKYGIDVKLARTMLKPFGKKPKFVLLGFLIVIGVFSMFMSNTATAAMMLTFLAPILKQLPSDERGRIGLALSIPIAANIGGMGTPIGTPPNAIALQYLNEQLGINVGFGEWAIHMIPFVIVMLLFAWVLLLAFFPFKSDKIELKIENTHGTDTKTIIVWVTFAVTILLWMLDHWTGLNANIVAMIPVGVFCATGVITKEDLKEVSWSVLWLVAGGFAIGLALDKTGLAVHMIDAIPFHTWPALLVIFVGGLIAYILSNFIANTAAANLVVPILGVLGGSAQVLMNLAPLGGVKTLIVGVAISCSLAMMFPISTPPNAIAHSTGLIKVGDMAKVGAIIGVVGLILGYLMLIVIGF